MCITRTNLALQSQQRAVVLLHDMIWGHLCLCWWAVAVSVQHLLAVRLDVSCVFNAVAGRVQWQLQQPRDILKEVLNEPAPKLKGSAAVTPLSAIL
jgi:hypothetical protein